MIRRSSFFLTLVACLSALAALVIPGLYGAYLAFKASAVLGIIVLIVEPAPSILGWVAILGHPELAAKITAWIGFPF